MKKIIFLLFLSTRIFSQGLVEFISATPDTICQNQLVVFKVHIDSAALAQFPNSTISVRDSSDASFMINGWTLKQIADSNYTFKLFVYTGDLSIGLNKMWVASGYGNQTSVKLYVKNCVLGIENYNSKENLLSTQYFNLLGQPIKEPDGVTVEVKTYVGGQREVRKIVTGK